MPETLDELYELPLEECRLATLTPVIAALTKPCPTSMEYELACCAVLCVECNYLGCPIPSLQFIDADMLDDSFYDLRSDTIFFRRNESDEWTETIFSLIHLAYHVYQKSVIRLFDSLEDIDEQKLLLLYDASLWASERSQLFDCESDTFFELDSVCYALKGVSDYIDAIETYLGWSVKEGNDPIRIV